MFSPLLPFLPDSWNWPPLKLGFLSKNLEKALTHKQSPSKQEQPCGSKDEPEGTALPTQMLTCIGSRPRGEMVMQPETKTGLWLHLLGLRKLVPNTTQTAPSWSAAVRKTMTWPKKDLTDVRKLQCWLYCLGRMCRLHTASSREERFPDPSHHAFLSQGKQCPFHWFQRAPNCFLRQRPA